MVAWIALFCRNLVAEFFVPGLSETANEGLLQIAVEGDSFAPTLLDRAAADVPLVIVDGLELAIVLNPDGIEMARDGFLIVDFAVSPRLLYGTEGQAVLDDGVCAFAALDKRRAGQTIDIDSGNALSLYDIDACCRHIWFHGGIDSLQYGYFVCV